MVSSSDFDWTLRLYLPSHLYYWRKISIDKLHCFQEGHPEHCSTMMIMCMAGQLHWNQPGHMCTGLNWWSVCYLILDLWTKWLDLFILFRKGVWVRVWWILHIPNSGYLIVLIFHCFWVQNWQFGPANPILTNILVEKNCLWKRREKQLTPKSTIYLDSFIYL